MNALKAILAVGVIVMLAGAQVSGATKVFNMWDDYDNGNTMVGPSDTLGDWTENITTNYYYSTPDYVTKVVETFLDTRGSDHSFSVIWTNPSVGGETGILSLTGFAVQGWDGNPGKSPAQVEIRHNGVLVPGGGHDLWAQVVAEGNQNQTDPTLVTKWDLANVTPFAIAPGDTVEFVHTGIQPDWLMAGWRNVEGTVAPVPEPATLSLLAIGVVGLVARRRRK